MEVAFGLGFVHRPMTQPDVDSDGDRYCHNYKHKNQETGDDSFVVFRIAHWVLDKEVCHAGQQNAQE